jgi:hypothetical protein
VHVPVALVIVKFAPEFEQAPPLENVTALPELPPTAATANWEPKTAEDGACFVTVIDWLAFVAVTDSVTWGAGL